MFHVSLIGEWYLYQFGFSKEFIRGNLYFYFITYYRMTQSNILLFITFFHMRIFYYNNKKKHEQTIHAPNKQNNMLKKYIQISYTSIYQ